MRSAAPLVLLLALTSACSHPLLLKKYSATTPLVPALKGRSVFVAPFADERKNEWKESEPMKDPPRFTYQEPTSEQLEQWNVERRKLGDGLPVSSLFSVGVMRNGFGMPIREVFSVNSPVQWLTDSTRLDREGAESSAFRASFISVPTCRIQLVRDSDASCTSARSAVR